MKGSIALSSRFFLNSPELTIYLVHLSSCGYSERERDPRQNLEWKHYDTLRGCSEYYTTMAEDLYARNHSVGRFAGCSLVSGVVGMLTEGTSEERMVDLPALNNSIIDDSAADELYNRRVAAYAEFTKTILSEIIAGNTDAADVKLAVSASDEHAICVTSIGISCFSTIRRTTGNSKAAVHLAFRQHLDDYLNGWTGDSRMSGNMGRHEEMIDLAHQSELSLIDEVDMERLTSWIAHRLDLRAFATELLELADVPLPFGLTCTEWTIGAARLGTIPYPKPPHLSTESFASTFMRLGKAEVCSEPARGQGHRWTDPPLRYMTAALGLAEYGDRDKAKKIQIMKDVKMERTRALTKKWVEFPQCERRLDVWLRSLEGSCEICHHHDGGYSKEIRNIASCEGGGLKSAKIQRAYRDLQ